jgi:hypothetical protein
VILINIWAFSCLYMGHFVPVLNGSCSCPPMGRDLGPNPTRNNGTCRPDTKIFLAVPCLSRAFFSVLQAGPSGPAQMYTYINGYTTPIFVEHSHERPFSIIPKANTYGFLTKKWPPPEIQECDLWQGNICGVRRMSLWSMINGHTTPIFCRK